MNKRIILLFLSALLCSAGTIHAQVTIGSENEPRKGTILDLKETKEDLSAGTAPQSGLALGLPRVALSSETTLTVVSNASDKDKRVHEGIMVYNTNTNVMQGTGVYVWDGAKWIAAKSSTSGTGGEDIEIDGTLGNIEYKYFDKRCTLETAKAACFRLGKGWRLPTLYEGYEIVASTKTPKSNMVYDEKNIDLAYIYTQDNINSLGRITYIGSEKGEAITSEIGKLNKWKRVTKRTRYGDNIRDEVIEDWKTEHMDYLDSKINSSVENLSARTGQDGYWKTLKLVHNSNGATYLRREWQDITETTSGSINITSRGEAWFIGSYYCVRNRY